MICCLGLVQCHTFQNASNHWLANTISYLHQHLTSTLASLGLFGFSGLMAAKLLLLVWKGLTAAYSARMLAVCRTVPMATAAAAASQNKIE
jgi:hypothetical protein